MTEHGTRQAVYRHRADLERLCAACFFYEVAYRRALREAEEGRP